MDDLKILAIIPARGGSKGLPRKNIKKLVDKPLIAHTISAALDSNYINRVVVSTEDQEILETSKLYRAEVMLRPPTLATDESSIIDVIIYVLKKLRGELIPDIIVLLQPTSPLRTNQDIDNAIKLYLEEDCNSIISVCDMEHPLQWTLKIKNSYLKPLCGKKSYQMQRNDLTHYYFPNGAIYISSPDKLLVEGDFLLEKTLPYIMPRERSVDIDSDIDFKFAEFLLTYKSKTRV